MHDALKKGAPCGSKFACNPSGYMTVAIFNDWFDHFLEHVKPSEDKPALLIIDGHSSHTKNLPFTQKARANFVTVLVLPPHCSNKMQPLDVSFMAPFKSYYASEVERFMQQNPGKVVGQYDVAELTKTAFIKAATMSVAVNGFCKTGIWPCNRNVFGEDAFAPSLVTDQPAGAEVPREGEAHQSDPGPTLVPSDGDHLLREDKAVQVLPEDIMAQCSGTDSSSTAANTPLFDVSPSEVLPLPKMITPRVTKRQRQAGKAADVTSNQYADTLKKAKASKDIQSIKKERKQRSSKNPKKKQCKADTSSDNLCDKCGCQFSDSDAGIGWTMCLQCFSWFHTGCHVAATTVCHNCS